MSSKSRNSPSRLPMHVQERVVVRHDVQLKAARVESASEMEFNSHLLHFWRHTRAKLFDS